MWESLLLDAAFAALLVVVWYAVWRQFNRRQGEAIVGWIQEAVSERVRVSAPRWRSASRFSVQLRFGANFRESSIDVGLTPREMPLNWLLARYTKRREWVMFQAELERRPASNLLIANHRWYGATDPKSAPPEECYSLGALVVTTREDWNTETALLETLLATRSHQFAHIELRKKAPHLLLTAPLESLRPGTDASGLFELLHELASCANRAPSS